MRLAPFLGGAAVVALAFVLGAVLPDPAAQFVGPSVQVSVTAAPTVVVLPQKADAGPDNYRFWCDATTVLCGYTLFDGGPTFIDGGPVSTMATYDAGCDGGLDSPYDAGCTFEGFNSDGGVGLGQDGGYHLWQDGGPDDGGHLGQDGGPFTQDGGPFALDGGPVWDNCKIGDGGPWYGFPSYCFFALDAGVTTTQLNLDGGNQQFDAGCKNALNPGTPLTAGVPESFQPGVSGSTVILVTFDAGGTCYVTDLSRASQ